MAKTKEELEQLRQRCIKLSNEIKELNDDELNIVSGGKDGRATRTINGITFSGHVRKYDGQINHMYYVTVDNDDIWYYGKLVSSYEEDVVFFWSERVHTFEIEIENGTPCYIKRRQFSGDKVTMYTSRS